MCLYTISVYCVQQSSQRLYLGELFLQEVRRKYCFSCRYAHIYFNWEMFCE